MWQVVGELAAEGVTVFLTTQYLEEAERLAETIAVLDGGRLIAEGTAAALKQQVAAQRLDVTCPDAAAYAEVSRYFGDRAIHRDQASPTWLRGFAEHQPATPVTETIRGLLLGHASPLPLASALAWCGGIMIVSVALSAILFRRRTAA